MFLNSNILIYSDFSEEPWLQQEDVAWGIAEVFSPLPKRTHCHHRHLSPQEVSWRPESTANLPWARPWAGPQLHPGEQKSVPGLKALTLSWTMGEERWVSLTSEEFNQLQKYSECK
jgi:hypothetical protein